MPHLKHIGLTNFRVFGERTDIALAPLTILTGPNSSGKSSVLKAIQLLQENVADIGYLNFSHGEHKLGNFDMTLNRDATDKTMGFSLPFEYKNMPEEMYMDWIYEMDLSNPLKYGKLTRLSVCLKKNGHEVIGIRPWNDFDIDLEYFHEHRQKSNFWINLSDADLMKHLRNYYIVNGHTSRYIKIKEKIKAFKKFNSEDDFLSYVISLLNKIKERLRLKFKFKSNAELSQLLDNELFNFEEAERDYFKDFMYDFSEETIDNLNKFIESMENLSIHHIYLDNRLEDESNSFILSFKEISEQEDVYNVLNVNNGFFPIEEISNGGSSIHENVGYILREALGLAKSDKQPFKEFQKDNFYYLEAIRATTQRIYTWQSQGTSFNQDLLNFVKSSSEDVHAVSEFMIDLYLNKFGIGKELKINVDEQGTGAYITIDGKPLADFGYGVTQFLPILIKIFSIAKLKKVKDSLKLLKVKWDVNNDKILYIEEPETNLHPKLQSLLADLFIDACKFGLQIIIETHSEYLIRKLQYLTAKKEITPQMTVIHYFYDPKEARPEGEPQVKQINIQTDGRLTGQFGAGFYDETARLMTAILTGETLN